MFREEDGKFLNNPWKLLKIEGVVHDKRNESENAQVLLSLNYFEIFPISPLNIRRHWRTSLTFNLKNFYIRSNSIP